MCKVFTCIENDCENFGLLARNLDGISDDFDEIEEKKEEVKCWSFIWFRFFDSSVVNVIIKEKKMLNQAIDGIVLI